MKRGVLPFLFTGNCTGNSNVLPFAVGSSQDGLVMQTDYLLYFAYGRKNEN